MARTRGRLTREEITEAALWLVDEHGVDQLTMRRLGQHLGVDPMAIYHHLPNKTAVLDGIVELLWQGVDIPPATRDEDWREALFGLFMAFRAHLLQHPRAVTVIGGRPVTTPALLTLVNVTLERLATAGLSGHDAMPLIDNLSGFTVGKLLAEVAMFEDGAVDRVREAMGTMTPETHPHLLSAMTGGYDMDPEEQFTRGLRALIDGWAEQPRAGS